MNQRCWEIWVATYMSYTHYATVLNREASGWVLGPLDLAISSMLYLGRTYLMSIDGM